MGVKCMRSLFDGSRCNAPVEGTVLNGRWTGDVYCKEHQFPKREYPNSPPRDSMWTREKLSALAVGLVLGFLAAWLIYG